ncbi:hypothetical protein [Streptomyces odontomachi]|uniref:hypothetical protein n=1 Tax=Streptomyces odontomachi TaxID=2944940 RepID=UPI00210A2F4A|nr:hypothetical protein [Streptomyces sp. ODS25]
MQLPALLNLCEDHMVNRVVHTVPTPHGMGPATRRARRTQAESAHFTRGDA